MTTEKAKAELLAEAAETLEGLRAEKSAVEIMLEVYGILSNAIARYADVTLWGRPKKYKKRRLKKHKKLKSCFTGKNPIKFVKPKKRRRRAKKGR